MVVAIDYAERITIRYADSENLDYAMPRLQQTRGAPVEGDRNGDRDGARQ
jgi:hypothetical protein